MFNNKDWEIDLSKKGKVFIIGAGPGDPGLITLKGLRSLAEADVVVYDYLASEDILRFAGKDSRLIYVGKKGGDHTLPQGEINKVLVDEALKGNTVARLKGGDPFVFGRGGEEAEILRDAGIPFEVIPGVTSAIAVPAFAGIPLTHRGYTSTVAFVTGHEDPTKEKSDIDWAKLSGIGTLVFLMGVKNLANIARNLITGGKSPETPAALIRWGTTPEQETLTGTLADIAGKAKKQGFKPPSILVVGEVVSLRPKLDWFETKPLFGKGIVVTRPEAQACEFAQLLAAEGARVILFPTIHVVPPANWTELDRALGGLESFHWIIFTSANGVKYFFRRLRETGKDIRDLKGIRICTIGPATAAAVEGMGIRVDIIPDEYISEGVVRAFQGVDLKGKRVLLPRAEEARDVIPEGLMKLGASVDAVTVYSTVRSESKKEALQALLDDGKVNVITFTSPSTVINFKAIMGPAALPEAVRVACIGPVTAAAAKKQGFEVHIFQETFTIPGMVKALVDYFSKK
jgi:uroporphyrinogen III methyltransferase/synthase